MTDPQIIRLERQKLAIDVLLKRKELRSSQKSVLRSLIENPVSLAIVGGLISVIVSIVTSFVTSYNEQILEREKAQRSLQSDLIKSLITTDRIGEARTNLEFLADVGLIPDYSAAIRRYLDENPNASPIVRPPDPLAARNPVVGTDDRVSIDVTALLESPTVSALHKRMVAAVGQIRSGLGECQAFRVRQDLILYAPLCLRADAASEIVFTDVTGKTHRVDRRRTLDLERLTVAPIDNWEEADAYLEFAASPAEIGSALSTVIRPRNFAGWATVGFDGATCSVLAHRPAEIVHDCDTGTGTTGAPLMLRDGSVVALHMGYVLVGSGEERLEKNAISVVVPELTTAAFDLHFGPLKLP